MTLYTCGKEAGWVHFHAWTDPSRETLGLIRAVPLHLPAIQVSPRVCLGVVRKQRMIEWTLGKGVIGLVAAGVTVGKTVSTAAAAGRGRRGAYLSHTELPPCVAG